MDSLKLLVTHRGRLLSKYGADGVAAIEEAVSRLAAADETRGIKTRYVCLDDAEEMKSLGSRSVLPNPSAASCKKAIDRIITRHPADYLVLLGADDVIPHFRVPNPTHAEEGDPEEEVPTDNPYASSVSFNEKSRATWLVPDRAIGRIPDVPGAGDLTGLLNYLGSAASSEPQDLTEFDVDLLVCCDTWRTSGSACVAEISRNAASLFLSPPTEEATEPFRDRHRAKLQMIKCHGAQLDPHFYGQQGEHFPPVLLSSSLIGRTEPGTVVGAMCCYGAAVYDPTDPAAIRPGTPAIANVYLSQSAAGFAGSTSIAWVGINDMACADLIICRFLKNVMTGVSLGAALLDSKQRFLAHINKDGRMPDAAEEKTLLQFLLLGDPSLRPVKSREERDERQPIVAAAGSFVRREQHGQYDDSGKGHLLSVKRVSPTAAAERRSRRHYHSGMARQLREQLPDRVAAEPPFTAEQILNADELAYLGARKPVVHRVSRQRVQPEIARRKRLTRAAAAALTVNADAVETVSHVLREETLQYYWFARTEREHVVDATVVKVETDLHGNVLRKQVLVTA